MSTNIKQAIRYINLAIDSLKSSPAVYANMHLDILTLQIDICKLRETAIMAELNSGLPGKIVGEHFGITPGRVSQIKKSNFKWEN